MDTIINYANDSEEEDQEEILDTEWINELKNNEDKYNDFYKEPVKSVIVYLLYVNKENELQHIHKDRCLIDNNNGILKREIIITFIKRYHHIETSGQSIQYWSTYLTKDAYQELLEMADYSEHLEEEYQNILMQLI